ncbi:hypothetical protein [Algibacter sp. R77976]|uniref:hypothetical protein n=1 Tax=Algibacter sp. R77976 TaxID=3093873 RepID=UPI0037CAAFFB
MKKFIKNLIIFFLFALLVGELIVRLTHATTDLPKREIDEYNIQKYYPNQSGYWVGGKHKWVVNKFGWPGELPKSYDNLITIIGDSYIENFMNPSECHQSVLLKKRLDKFNFIEAARSGVSFIEAMEISKQLDSLSPIYNLVYVNSKDFYESVANIQPAVDIMQLDIEKKEIIYGQMKSPGLKKVLYNWKLLYYFYNKFPLNLSKIVDRPEKTVHEEAIDDFKYKNEIQSLLDYTKLNYNIKNKILVFHPNSELEIIEICKNSGFKVIVLNSDNDESWTFEHDNHWTCYGHERVAYEIVDYFLNFHLLKLD